MKKIVLTSIALATLAASPAFAASAKHVTHRSNAAAQESYAAAVQDPYAVVVEGQLVGRDPDAGIRAYLLRDNGLNAD